MKCKDTHCPIVFRMQCLFTAVSASPVHNSYHKHTVFVFIEHR